MLKKQLAAAGAVMGLVMGICIFLFGISSTPDSPVLGAINLLQTPLIPLAAVLQGNSINLTAYLYKLVAVMMCYWALLGALAGLAGGQILDWKKCRVA